MATQDEIARQAARDDEYRRACAAFGIDAALPKYRVAKPQPPIDTPGADEGRLDFHHQHGDALHRPENPDPHFFDHIADEEADPEPPAIPEDFRVGVWKLLDFLVGKDAARKGALTRLTALCWLVNHGGAGSFSLADHARRIGCTKASLSQHAKAASAIFGVVSLGQRPSASASCRAARHRVVARERGIREADAEAVIREAEAPAPPEPNHAPEAEPARDHAAA